MSLQQALESFINDRNAFESAVDRSTQASWGGGYYIVELFQDGFYRVLPEVGNLYDTTGLILAIPTLGDDEWDEDPSVRYYDGAEQDIRDAFEELMLLKS